VFPLVAWRVVLNKERSQLMIEQTGLVKEAVVPI
jgi:hypothetical protein